MKSIALCLALAYTTATALAADGPAFETDPNSPTLQALAKPLVVDESQYGCGPLLKPGRTYYVSLRGDDAADGASWAAAFRHVRAGLAKLKAGDTLVIGEGEYIEPDLRLTESGEPGRPITVMAAPRQRVIISAAVRPELERTPETSFIWEAARKLKGGHAMVWEADTKILLEYVAGVTMVDELPGTWAYDAEQGKIYAHFADSRTSTPHPLAVRPGQVSVSHFRKRHAVGFEVRGSYVHLKGLWFEHDNVCMIIQGDVAGQKDGAKTYRGGNHVTVEECAFSSTCFAGLVLYAGAEWNLMRGNYGRLNGARGSLIVNHKDTHDNLFIRNRFDPSTPTIRERGWKYHFGISNYGHVGPRNHIVNNVMNGTHSFRSKFMFKEHVLQGNVMLGACGLVPCTYYKLEYRPIDRVIFRNNVFLGRVSTVFQTMPPCGPGGNWCDEFKAFVNNFVPNTKDKAKSIAAARFADPAYLDYRLQADSPLRGKALGGGDVGAFRQPQGRILYVSPKGDDANPGTSDAKPWGTFAKATATLQPGDTLYVLPGVYTDPLVVTASGTEQKPITIRARGKKDVTLPSVQVSGSWVTLEGFTVTAKAGDGVVVTGRGVTLDHCIVRDCAGCGVKATGANALTLSNCTLVGNGTGLSLESGSADAAVRECIFASNATAAVAIGDDSRGGWLGSGNCYFGDGLDAERIGREWGSVVGDPKFVDAGKGDLRLAWDSPAAHLAPFGQSAGAKPATPRTPEIESIQVSGISNSSAVLTWRTPKDDTIASVAYCAKGSSRKKRVRSTAQGTVHGVGLTKLKPTTEYEFTVQAKSCRGGAAVSAAQTFTTSDQPHAPTTYYVAPAGNDGADGRSAQTAWQTIRRACFAVAPGDTVLIAPGVYHHAIAPLTSGAKGRRITFRREGEGAVVIDGAKVVAPLVLLDHKHYVTVAGIMFENLPPAGHPGVFKGEHSKGVEVLNCRIGYKRRHGGFGNGVYFYRCDDARIEGNVIWGTRYHVTLNQCAGTLVKNNTFTWGQVFSAYFIGKHDGCRFVNNIFYFPTSVPNAALVMSYPSKDIKMTSDYNCFGPMVNRTQVAYVYSGSLSNLLAHGPGLEEWQRTSGQDAHSVQADPLFVNPRAGDFRLKAGSPAIGAGEGGLNMGACGAALLSIKGRTSLLPGEGRTIRMAADWTGAGADKMTFCWHLPKGETREGAALEYAPPADVARFELKLTATDAKGQVSTAREFIAVPSPELAAPGKNVIRIEAEDFVAQGKGEVRFYKLINTSGKSITHWNAQVGHWLEWEFAAPRDGEYLIYARYTTNITDRSRSLTLDGASPGPAYDKIPFPRTGGWSLSSDNWAFKKLGPAVKVSAGKHRIRMTNLDSAVNFDYLIVIPAPGAQHADALRH